MSTNTPSSPAGHPAGPSARLRVWDGPTRIFHWLLVVAVVGALVTVQLGGLYMDWHVRFGQLALALVVFRLVWGFCGPRYARFSQFLRGPSAVLDYVRGKTPAGAGHNPLGGWSVVAMLLVIGFQAVSGLFANDEILTAGPLAGLVSNDTSLYLTYLHSLNEILIYGLIVLHLLAVIVWYTLIRRKRIIPPMITGKAPAADLPAGTVQAEAGARVWLRALLVAALAIAVMWAIHNAAPPVSSAYY